MLTIFISVDSAKVKESVDVILIATYLHTEPTVAVKNAVNFSLSCIITNAEYWYTERIQAL